MTCIRGANTSLMIRMLLCGWFATAEKGLPGNQASQRHASRAVDSLGKAFGKLGSIMDSRLLRTGHHLSQNELKADIAYAEKHWLDDVKLTCASFHLPGNCHCTDGVTACGTKVGCLFSQWGILSDCTSTGALITDEASCGSLQPAGTWCTGSSSLPSPAGGLATKKKQGKQDKKRNSDWSDWTSSSLSEVLANMTFKPAPGSPYHNNPGEIPMKYGTNPTKPTKPTTPTLAEKIEENPPLLIHSIGCPFSCSAKEPSALSGGPCNVHCPCYRETSAYLQHPCYGVKEQDMPTLNDGHCLTTIINYCCWDHLAGKMLTEMRTDLQFCRNLNFNKDTNTGYECPVSKMETCGDASWMAILPSANHSMYLSAEDEDCGTSCSASMTLLGNDYKSLQWMPVMVHGSYFILRHISQDGMNCLTNHVNGPTISTCGLPGNDQLWVIDEQSGAIQPKTCELCSKKCLAVTPSNEGGTLSLKAVDSDTELCVDKTGLPGGESSSWVICPDPHHCKRH